MKLVLCPFTSNVSVICLINQKLTRRWSMECPYHMFDQTIVTKIITIKYLPQTDFGDGDVELLRATLRSFSGNFEASQLLVLNRQLEPTTSHRSCVRKSKALSTQSLNQVLSNVKKYIYHIYHIIRPKMFRYSLKCVLPFWDVIRFRVKFQSIFHIVLIWGILHYLQFISYG